MALVYNAAVRDQARADLDDAARLAPPGSIEARRVAMYRESFRFLEGFADAMDGRTVHDYVRAKRGLDTMIDVRDALSGVGPAVPAGIGLAPAVPAGIAGPTGKKVGAGRRPPLITRKAEEYMNRYLTSTITQGYARTTGGNRLLAGLKDEWLFQIDPERVGEAIGWWDPARTGGNWQTIRTSSRTWSDQGLRYYKGLAWYRQTIDIPWDDSESRPTQAVGRRVFLWFGAIDEMAKVWLNGRLIGTSPRIVFKPFEMDATEAIRPGKPNTLVVCITNEVLNELGTGGIMGPVIFYARPTPAPAR